MSQVVDGKDERISRLLRSLERTTAGMEEWAVSHKPVLGGEHYFTDNELSELLKVSRRTLQEWRNNGRIAYFLLGGKILYAESDILKTLEKHYHKLWE